MAIVIGITVGSTFTPSVLAGASDWLPTLLAIVLYTFAALAVGFAVLRVLGGYDPVTSYCMSAPGGFLEMIVLATRSAPTRGRSRSSTRSA